MKINGKKQLENELNKVFGCKDIHVHEVRDVDDAKLIQLLITNSNYSLRMQFVKKGEDIFTPIMIFPKISMVNFGKIIDYVQEYFDERQLKSK